MKELDLPKILPENSSAKHALTHGLRDYVQKVSNLDVVNGLWVGTSPQETDAYLFCLLNKDLDETSFDNENMRELIVRGDNLIENLEDHISLFVAYVEPSRFTTWERECVNRQYTLNPLSLIHST